jgi:hypothetical protein
MLTTKVVVRLLDDAGALLGWEVIQAEARGDGCLWAPTTTVVPFEANGRAAVLSLHLADLHLEVRRPIDVAARPGTGVTLAQPLVRLGEPPVGLPPVTVRASPVIAVPVGTLGPVTR